MPKKKTIPRSDPLTPELACRLVAEKCGFGPIEQEWGTELLMVLDNARIGHREGGVITSLAVALIAYGGMVESRRGRVKPHDAAFVSDRVGVLAQALADSCRTPGELMLIVGTALGMVMKAIEKGG